MKLKRYLFYFLAIAGLCISYSVFPQEKVHAFDQKRMDRDLRIMEGVIDKLLSEGSEHHLDGRTKGLYIQDYGIVFHSEKGEPLLEDKYSYRIFMGPKTVNKIKKSTKENGEDELKHLGIVLQSDGDEASAEIIENEEKLKGIDELSDEELKQKEQEALEKIKKQLFSFYKNYVPAIRQLKQDDHIAVLIDFDEWHSIQSESTYLTSWTTMKDVQNFRNHQLTESQLKEKIHFQTGQPESDITTDIGIMLEIFDRGLDGQNRFDHMNKSGVYLNNFGALFFMDIPHLYFLRRGSDKSVMIIAEEYAKKSITYHFEGGKKKDIHKEVLETDRAKDVEKIKDNVFDLLASYGHTLRMPENEWIVLNLNLGENYFLWQPVEKELSHMLIQIRKKDLDDYNAANQSLDSLWKKAIFKKY